MSPVRSGWLSPGVVTVLSTSLDTMTGLDHVCPWSLDFITETLKPRLPCAFLKLLICRKTSTSVPPGVIAIWLAMVWLTSPGS